MSKIVTYGKVFLIASIIFLGGCPAFGGAKTFDKIFKLENTIKLELPKNTLPNILSLTVGKDRRIWATSGRPDKSEVRIYSSTGEVLNVISKKDIPKMPGYPYTFFTDVAFGHNYQTYILEAVSGNIAVIDSTGRFLQYFPKEDDCAGAGGSIKIDNEQNVYFGGPCHQEIEDRCPKSRAFCIHKYDSKGKYIKSFFPLERSLFELTSDPIPYFDHVYFDLDQNGNIWCIHKMVYEIFEYSPDGKLLQKFPGKSYLYKAPPTPPSTKSKEAERVWRSSWTPICNLLVLEPNLILIFFDIYSKNVVETYLEIYDENGNIILPDIQTDYHLLGKDDEGLLYFFLPNLDDKKESPKYMKIGKFSLNLSAISKSGKQ